MNGSQIPPPNTSPRWIKLAVGATAASFLAAWMFELPTVDRTRNMERQAQTQATALESAINNFQTEYGSLPNVGNHLRTDSPDGVKLLNILLGSEKGTPKQNPKNLRFLMVREAKSKKNGIQYDQTDNAIKGLYDSWGHPYIIELNFTKEEKLSFQYGGKIKELPGRFSTAYSMGKDGKAGTSDDVLTW